MFSRMTSPTKTNVIRIVESLGIPHRVVSYECDGENLDAATVARSIGAPEEQVFKTLVTRNDKDDIYVFCVPGNSEIDFKKAARITGSKKIDMIGMKELLPLTGYVRGGCSPVGMKKKYPVYIDELALVFDRIYISAGIRGLQLEIEPGELCRICDAAVADVTG